MDLERLARRRDHDRRHLPVVRFAVGHPVGTRQPRKLIGHPEPSSAASRAARASPARQGPERADRVDRGPGELDAEYVLSRTLRSVDDWNNTTIVGYDEVPGLRERLNLVSYGCGRLARDLLRDGLLDELQLWFAPVVTGSGRRLFDEPDELLELQLAATRAFATGAVRLTYGAPRA